MCVEGSAVASRLNLFFFGCPFLQHAATHTSQTVAISCHFPVTSQHDGMRCHWCRSNIWRRNSWRTAGHLASVFWIDAPWCTHGWRSSPWRLCQGFATPSSGSAAWCNHSFRSMQWVAWRPHRCEGSSSNKQQWFLNVLATSLVLLMSVERFQLALTAATPVLQQVQSGKHGVYSSKGNEALVTCTTVTGFFYMISINYFPIHIYSFIYCWGVLDDQKVWGDDGSMPGIAYIDSQDVSRMMASAMIKDRLPGKAQDIVSPLCYNSIPYYWTHIIWYPTYMYIYICRWDAGWGNSQQWHPTATCFFPSPGAHRGSDADFDGSQGLVHQWRDQTLRGAGKGWRTYETHLANEYDIYIYIYTI